MAYIIVPSRRGLTRQPQGLANVDWSNPLTAKLDYAFVGGQRFDLVRNAPCTSYASRGVSRDGLLSGGNLDYRDDADAADITLLLVPNISGVSGGYIGFTWGFYGSASVSSQFGLSTNVGSATIYGVNRANGGGATLIDTATYPYQPVLAMVGTMQPGVAASVFKNGRFLASVPKSGTGAFTKDSRRFFQVFDTGTVQSAALALKFSRQLSAAEIKSLSENPWQIFRPRTRRIFVSQGTSGGTTLNAAASGQSQASGTAQLAAQVALAGIGVAVAGGQAAAAVAVPLSAAGIAVAGGQADARATVAITATGLAQAAGQAGLSATVLAQAAGAAQAAGNAQLAAQLQALASGAAQASGAANLSGGAPGVLSAAGTAEASGAAVLTVTVNLAAAGNAQAGGSAQAGARVDGQAAGSAQAGGSAALTGGAPGMLAAAGNAVAGGWASWSVLVNVTAAGFAQAMGAGQLSIEVPLAASGQAIAGGQATGTLLGETRHYRLKADFQRITRLASSAQRLTTITHEVRHVG